MRVGGVEVRGSTREVCGECDWGEEVRVCSVG